MTVVTLDGPMEAAPLAERSASMRAIAQGGYGTEPENVLRFAEIPRPAIGNDEVLVRVAAAGIDRGTWHVMSGLPRLMRIAGFGLRAPKALNPGRSLAGIVESVGTDVIGFKPGDEVYGTGTAAFAEYARAKQHRLAPKPASLSFEQAAAVPVSAQTALQAVRDQAHVREGQTVLVIGASGGVGTFAVQIAKSFGAEVTGVCSASKVDFVRRIGADHVIDYTSDNFTAGERLYDVILDIGGNLPLSQLRRALAARGRLVIVGGENGARWFGVGRQLRAQLLSPLVTQKLGTFIASENSKDLTVLADLIELRQVTPAVDRAYALSDVASAIRYMLNGHVRGKVVIAVRN